MSVLLIERMNHKFRRLTNSLRQVSGLSVCTQMIAESVEGVHRIEVDNIFHIENAISMFRPKKVLLQGLWASREDLINLTSKFKKVKFFNHIHSNIPFLACDSMAFHHLKMAHELGVMTVVNDVRSLAIPGSVHLPNVYVRRAYASVQKEEDGVHIVCAGSLRPMKNQATQALAAILFANSLGKKLYFYANMGRSEGGDNIKTALTGIFSMWPEHELISIPWMEHEEFLSFLSSKHYGLQVSLTETFNICAADYTTVNLPMVVSDEVQWAHPLVKADCGAAEQICEKLKICHEYTEQNKRNLDITSNQAIGIWRDFVSS